MFDKFRLAPQEKYLLINRLSLSIPFSLSLPSITTGRLVSSPRDLVGPPYSHRATSVALSGIRCTNTFPALLENTTAWLIIHEYIRAQRGNVCTGAWRDLHHSREKIGGRTREAYLRAQRGRYRYRPLTSRSKRTRPPSTGTGNFVFDPGFLVLPRSRSSKIRLQLRA